MSTRSIKLARRINKYRQRKEAAKKLMQKGDLSTYLLKLTELRAEKRQLRSLLATVTVQ